MSGPTVPIAPIPLARSARRLAAVPLVLLLVGLIAAAAGVLRGDVWGMGLVVAGALIGVLSVGLWLMLLSVKLDVEVATLRIRRLGGERRYTLVRGPVTRVALRGPDAARLRPSIRTRIWGLGRARLRADETIELIRMAPTDTMILVPTDRGRVGIAPASEQQLLSALGAAARIQQRLDEVAERAKAFTPAPQPLPPPPPQPAPAAPAAAAQEPGAGHVLTGIERAILEERLAAQRAAALQAAESERQAAADAARMAAFMAAEQAEKPIMAAVQRPARRRSVSLPAVNLPAVNLPRPRVQVARPRLEVSGDLLRDFAVLLLPVLAAVGVWAVAANGQRLDLPPTQLRPVAAALLATGPAAALAGIAARVWFPRLLGLVTITSLIGVGLVARALLG
ncbi:MAG TPA: hypothetical protein VHU77_10375 [Candidatus Limnocylindria bacterium]|nr:hypothetical protein [Candidatus Limnocylindria bacterium]